jgi:hypothetical protein
LLKRAGGQKIREGKAWKKLESITDLKRNTVKEERRGRPETTALKDL